MLRVFITVALVAFLILRSSNIGSIGAVSFDMAMACNREANKESSCLPSFSSLKDQF